MAKRLYKINNSETMVGGVVLGMSEYFGVDPVLLRILFAVLIFTPAPIIIIYLVLYFVLPEKNTAISLDEQGLQENDYQHSISNNMSKNQQKNGLVGGMILIALGVIFSFKTFFHINLFHYIGKMWPLGLVALGIWLIVKDRNGNNFQNPSDGSDSF